MENPMENYLRYGSVPRNTYLTMSEQGGLVQWVHEGIPVFLPSFIDESGEKPVLRGGLPAYFPCFGDMPEGLDLERSCNLPRHGLRDMTTDQVIVFNGGIAGNFTHDSDEQFGWSFSTELRARFTSKHSIEHLVYVKNDSGSKMPVSGGLHTYFPTHGEYFRIRNGDEQFTLADITEGETIAVPLSRDLVVSLTHGTVTIAVHQGGYDELLLWTKDSKKYICVETVKRGFGSPNGRWISPAGLTSFGCNFAFAPKGEPS